MKNQTMIALLTLVHVLWLHPYDKMITLCYCSSIHWTSIASLRLTMVFFQCWVFSFFKNKSLIPIVGVGLENHLGCFQFLRTTLLLFVCYLLFMFYFLPWESNYSKNVRTNPALKLDAKWELGQFSLGSFHLQWKPLVRFSW
jgi:hypothetical protein